MRFLSQIGEEVEHLEKERFDFLYNLNLKLRPSDFGRRSLIRRDRVASKFYAMLMDEAFVSAGYARKEVVVR